MKYQKKPVIVEAYKTDREMDIQTLEGTMHASVGDYIITGVNGEQYPCKPDIFAKTYELLVKAKSADEIAAERRHRFIDGEKLSSKIAGHSYYHGDAILSKIGVMMEGKDTGNSVRPANVVAVVRCRECRHRDPEDHKCDCGEMERQGRPFPVDDDYYCSYGERKGGNGKMKIGDLWRKKTDEELANSLLNIVSNGKCPAGRYAGDDDCTTMKRCYDCWLDWLKQEVSDDQR